MGRKGLWFRIVAIAFVLLSLIGCATHQFPRESEKVGRLKDIAVVVDASVTHGRTMKDPLLSVPENEVIAARLGALTADVLRVKGYLPLPPVHIVGMTAKGRIEVLFSDSTETVASRPASPPFLIGPKNNGITDERARDLFSKANGGWLPKDANPFEPTPVVVIIAQGHFISGGAMAANIGKGALNTLLVIGMAAGGGGGGNANLMEMDKDNLALTFRLFDPVTGVLLWQDQIKESGNADETTFVKEISKMLDRLPNVTK